MSGALVVSVWLTPRAARDRVEGSDAAGVIHARVSAPPVDGAANQALVKLLAAALRVPPSSIEIVGGATGRSKRLRIVGIDADAIRARWPGVRTSAD